MPMTLTKPAIDLGIVTTNGDAMLAFYRDVLGLVYQGQIPMPVGGGVMHRMLCGDSLIKLVVVPQTGAAPALKPAPATPGGIQGGAGYRYWTITVGNLGEMVKACADAGHPVVIPQREIRPGVSIAMVADPDGNWVEFLSLA